MHKVIGYLFVAMCPFVAGIAPFAALAVADILTGDEFALYFVAYAWIWVLAYCLWFDGSRFQKVL